MLASSWRQTLIHGVMSILKGREDIKRKGIVKRGETPFGFNIGKLKPPSLLIEAKVGASHVNHNSNGDIV